MRRRILDPDVKILQAGRYGQALTLFYSFAGSDTTSTTIRVLMMYIISHYNVQKTLVEECQSAGVPLTEIIYNRRAKELPYLQACIAEALRVFPSSAGLVLKDAP